MPPRLSFQRLFQLSSGLMGGLLAMKLYVLASSLLTPGVEDASVSLVSDALALPASATPKNAQSGSAPPANAVPEQGAASAAANDVCSKDTPCVGQTSDPSLDIDHRAEDRRQTLIADVAQRDQELKEEARSLDEMKQALETSREALESRLKRYDQEQSTLQKKGQDEKRLSDGDIDRLVKIYEAMAPRDAASIFNVLDLQVLVPVMGKMNPRKASAILAGMSPERATTTTQALAGLFPRRVMVRSGESG
ncbi:hypothetical protein AA23498_1057 [Acetobacter nitrogenifigens DSM 23921 = NBRC 105050]|uniref:Magnesium transporter MgtE intracellular domain-containing protein n=1 Tax=Acetobacter nitrogenifigens DSM 23921 = NBRC 105050 TaxID=1120919 RepID=A0A511XAM9_9PROT|nr:hypothetical protein [Acetobacter nitrogenifigens]GBQ91053.1 hypothetical protein AA23498_1057 [Acetobacter nitrogenifigens DSM 23921 = NBRC 105050]GEN60017.1 hypothetical protein ANI02nite_19010 [Acetobacter nitrogenifigens DSM 23921 = NBRC 105050]